MEKFLPLTKAILCNNQSGISMTFRDNSTFERAKQLWDWANGAENRSFILVAGAGDCGWNVHRQPFIIQSVDFTGADTAKLNGRLASWQDVAHSFHLVVGRVGNNGTQFQPAKRDYTKDFSIPMDLDFPFQVGLSADGVSSTLTCSDCGTSGHFNIELDISTWLFIPTGASVKIYPSGLQATAELTWSLAGELSGTLNKEWTPVSIPTPATLEIPEVLTIGPTLNLVVGITLDALKAQAIISGGAIASISDSAIIEIDLLDPLNNKFSGWLPSVEALPFSVDAEITATVGAYLALALALEAEALGHGYELELELRLPYFNGKFDYIVSSSGVCNSDKTMGVDASLSVGGALQIDAKELPSDDSLFSIQLGSKNFPLASACWAFGPGVGQPTQVGNPNPPGTSSPPGPSGSSCTQNDGTPGTCISTSECAAKGMVSEAGHCPGASDIQVRAWCGINLINIFQTLGIGVFPSISTKYTVQFQRHPGHTKASSEGFCSIASAFQFLKFASRPC